MNMRKYLLILLLVVCTNISGQVQNINNYELLIKHQQNLDKVTSTILVWGEFKSWGKLGQLNSSDCNSKLDQKIINKITSCIGFNLYGDSTKYCYLPIKQSANIKADYKEGDFIKLKIKLYKNCFFLNDSLFFLIEEIL